MGEISQDSIPLRLVAPTPSPEKPAAWSRRVRDDDDDDDDDDDANNNDGVHDHDDDDDGGDDVGRGTTPQGGARTKTRHRSALGNFGMGTPGTRCRIHWERTRKIARLKFDKHLHMGWARRLEAMPCSSYVHVPHVALYDSESVWSCSCRPHTSCRSAAICCSARASEQAAAA